MALHHTRTSPLTRRGAAVLAAAVLLTGCGTSDDEVEPTPTAADTTEATPTQAPPTTEPTSDPTTQAPEPTEAAPTPTPEPTATDAPATPTPEPTTDNNKAAPGDAWTPETIVTALRGVAGPTDDINASVSDFLEVPVTIPVPNNAVLGSFRNEIESDEDQPKFFASIETYSPQPFQAVLDRVRTQLTDQGFTVSDRSKGNRDGERWVDLEFESSDSEIIMEFYLQDLGDERGMQFDLRGPIDQAQATAQASMFADAPTGDLQLQTSRLETGPFGVNVYGSFGRADFEEIDTVAVIDRIRNQFPWKNFTLDADANADAEDDEFFVTHPVFDGFNQVRGSDFGVSFNFEADL